MRILYGIQGTGNGHITRSTKIIDALQKKGCNVDVIFSGCDTNKIYDSSVIKPVGFYKGFTFSIKQGKIQVLATAKNLSLWQFIKDVLSFDASGYDLVITDFEPVSSMIAKKNKVPCIGIEHQYAFFHNIPMDRSNLAARLIIRYFAPADYTIGMHWHHFDQPIVPPVIPDLLTLKKKTVGNLILVYLPFEDPDHIQSLCSAFPEFNFAVYGGSSETRSGNDANIKWHPFSKTVFYDDLAACSGVICNAGFELPGEALSLGKKLLVKPLIGQFEQVSNAMALEMLDLGMVMNSLDKNKLRQWLAQSPKAGKDYSDVADLIALWILDGNWSDIKKLVSMAWN
jgi:uncharacterized protein (TIGR00661 family)